MRQQIQTAGDIAAAQTESDQPPWVDAADSLPSESDASSAPDTTLPSGAGDGTSDDSGSRRRPSLPFIVFLVGAALAAGGSWLWWQAEHDDQLAAAEDRNAALISATEGIETLNTLDHRDVAADLAAWEDVTTGLMHDQIAATDQTQRQQLADQLKISTGEVVDAAVLRLDGSEATVVAAVEVTVVDEAAPGSEPTLKRNRFSADLKLVGGEWKIESLQQVAVSLS